MIQDDVNLNTTQIDNYTRQIDAQLIEEMNETIPKSGEHTNTNPYTSKTIKKITKHKYYLLTKLHLVQKHNRYNHFENLIVKIKSLIKITKNKIKNLMNDGIENHWEKTLGKINCKQPEKLFPIINKIFRPRTFTEPPNLTINNNETVLLKNSKIDIAELTKTNNEYTITEPTDKVKFLGAYFENVNSPRQLNANTRIRSLVDKETDIDRNIYKQRLHHPTSLFAHNNKATNPKPSDQDGNHFCNIPKVNIILKKLPNKTSSGHDSIPSVVVKHLLPNYIRNYTILFKNALNLKYFPAEWKKAKVVPILKKWNPPTPPPQPANDRPISLTPNISKVFELIINNRLVKHCEKYNIIPNNQHGFRTKHSMHAINKLSSDISMYLNDGKIVGATLIDLEEAFDWVWINGLIYKMKRKYMNNSIIIRTSFSMLITCRCSEKKNDNFVPYVLSIYFFKIACPNISDSWMDRL